MGNAAKAGYFQEQERTATAAFLGSKILPMHFERWCDRIAILEPRVREIRQMRETFKAEQPELYEVLYEDIENNVGAAYFRT